MELQEIIKKIKWICNQEGLTVKPDTILEQSVDIMLSKKISESQKQIQEMKNKELATPKQVNLLKKLNKYKEGITKQEAYQIIKELKYKEY